MFVAIQHSRSRMEVLHIVAFSKLRYLHIYDLLIIRARARVGVVTFVVTLECM
jgi:hypothetical protein